LHTDSETVANAKAPLIWAEQIEVWEAKLSGDTSEAEERLAAAERLAKVRGYRYLPAPKVAELPLSNLMSRVEKVKTLNTAQDAAALLGGVAPPAITITRALELYWHLARDRVLGKSEDQRRRWENPRKKAIRNLAEVIGNKPIAEITGDDMLEFRDWWLDRIEIEGLTGNSGNKDLSHLGDVLKTVNSKKRLGLTLPLDGLSITQKDAGTRPPFSRKWIKEQLLAPGALDGLNDQARAILLCMVNTGMRPSELAGLSAREIRLDHAVPHLAIEGIDRQLKSANARRTVPLIGVSLHAIEAFPAGFDRYRGSSASLSGTINKYLRENGLLESPAHSLYGLRHSFEDRMLAAKIDERIRRDLMGHALGRERYGLGASLEMLAELLAPVAF